MLEVRRRDPVAMTSQVEMVRGTRMVEQSSDILPLSGCVTSPPICSSETRSVCSCWRGIVARAAVHLGFSSWHAEANYLLGGLEHLARIARPILNKTMTNQDI
jgi:hypothetical protein